MEDYKVFQTRTKNQYDLVLFQHGYEKCKSTQSFGPFRRDCYMLHFVVGGQGVYSVRGKKYSLKKGDVFLIIPEEDTFYAANPEDPYEYYWIAFRGSNTEKILSDIGFFKNDNFVIHVEEKESAVLQKHIDNIFMFDSIDEKTYAYILGQLYVILSLLLPQGDIVRNHVELDDACWKKAQEYVAQHFGEDISVEDISLHLCIHRSNLYKLFKKRAGVSPSKYISEYRLNKAFFMVKFTNEVFKQISDACGFSDLSYFYKSFKKKFQRTPQEVRDLD